MTDKEKFRKEVEKLKSNLVYGACSSQVAMETRCKEEAYNEVLAILDNTQEEPVSIWHDASDKPNIKEKSGIFVITSLNGEYIGSRYYNHNDITITLGNYDKWAYLNDLLNLSNVQRTGKNLKEPVSEDLGGYINELSKQFPEVSFAKLSRIAVRVAKWQKEHLWKPADGDDLPEIDREVIALLDRGKVVFAHRPPEYWDGKNIVTGKVTRNYPKTYDKCGWNIPDVKWWLDCLIPKEIEL